MAMLFCNTYGTKRSNRSFPPILILFFSFLFWCVAAFAQCFISDTPTTFKSFPADRFARGVYSSAGLFHTGEFMSAASALPVLHESIKYITDGLEEEQMRRRGTRKGAQSQSTHGCISVVSRGALRLLCTGLERLTAHPLAEAVHTAATTEVVVETFFSTVTCCLGAARMTAPSQAEWGAALSRATLRWLRGLPGVMHPFSVRHRIGHYVCNSDSHGPLLGHAWCD